jgi:hypothetical protein
VTLLLITFGAIVLALGILLGAILFGERDARSPTLPKASVRRLARAARRNREELRRLRIKTGTAHHGEPVALDHFEGP